MNHASTLRRRAGFLLGLFAAGVLFPSVSARAAESDAAPKPLPEWAPLAIDGGIVYAAAANSMDGVVYGEADGEQLTFDYYPAAGPAPHPAVIIIHGGWFHGTSKAAGEIYPADFLTPAGYAVFSINFRMGRHSTLGDKIDDVQRAIRFIRFNAARWGVDPGRIALLGGSAGGYLSNMVGLTAAPGRPDADDPVKRVDARVQAVVTMYGVSDLRPIIHRPWVPGRPTLEEWAALVAPFATSGRSLDEIAGTASPVMNVKAGAPPFLLIHGTKDEAVPYAQSTAFQQALQAAGVENELLPIPDALHTTVTWHRVPGMPDWEKHLLLWLNHHLQHEGPMGEGIRGRVTWPRKN